MKQKIIRIIKFLFNDNYKKRDWTGDNNNSLGI